MNEQIVILDFGSQYTQVIARRVRECNVYSTILRFDTPAAEIAALKPKGIILSGGPSSVYSPKAPLPDPVIFQLGVPVLGICYGVQLLAQFLGGKVDYIPATIFDGYPKLMRIHNAVRDHAGVKAWYAKA